MTGNPDTLIGRALAGRYHLLSILGRGGMATVYKAHQPDLDRFVAVKVIAPDLARDAVFVERFRREARTIARLRHPSILTIYDFGVEDGPAGAPFLVTELLGGGTLRDHLPGPLPFPRTFRIVEQVGAALDYAHRNGIVHRDVKPANIFVGVPEQPPGAAPADDWSDRRIVLADFGIAKAATEPAEPGLTASGAGVGTAEYLAPEQALGQAVDGRVDLYALGLILYEALAGRPPFQAAGPADTPMALALRRIHDAPPAPSCFNPAIPPALDAVVLRAIARTPTGRYSTGAALVAACRAAVTSPGAAETPAVAPARPGDTTPGLPEQTTAPLVFDEPFEIARNEPARAPQYAPRHWSELRTARSSAAPPPEERTPRWLFAAVPALMVLLLATGALLVFLGRPLIQGTGNADTAPTAVAESTTVPTGFLAVPPPAGLAPTPLAQTALPTASPSPGPTSTAVSTPTPRITTPRPAAASTPSPRGTGTPADTRVRQAADRALAGLPGTASGAFVASDLVVLRDADRVLPAASLIKLVIAGETYRQAAAGQLSLSDTITVRQSDVVGGTGILQHQVGSTHTLDALVEIMLLHSDNTAGNMLIDRLGGFAPLNRFAGSLGLTNTQLNRKFLDTGAQARGIENTTTARDVTTFLLQLSRGQVVDPAASARILDILRQRGRIDRSWQLLNVPAGVGAAHITGTLGGLRLDAAIVDTPGGSYTLVTFVQSPDTAAAERAIAAAAADVYRAVNGR